MKPRIQIIHNTAPDTQSEIEAYLHCPQCLKELPKGESPQMWGRYEVGITRTGGIQVWCKRHRHNVDLMEFKVAEGDSAPIRGETHAFDA